MADIREGIISEGVSISGTIPGVAAVGRNRTDVTGLARPAIVWHDGAEEVVSQPESASDSLIQLHEMTPDVEILVGGAPDRVGATANLILARLRYRIVTSTTIRQLIGTNGKIFIQGAALIRPTPESRELRMDCRFTFRYFFRAEDLADL